MRTSFLCLVLLSLNSMWAQGEDVEPLFESARQAGRGKTFVAAQDSDEASRFNPAALASGRVKFQLRFFGFDAFTGENTVNTLSDISKMNDSSTGGISFLRKFNDKFGKRQYFRGQISPLSLRVGGFEFSPFASNASWLEFNDPPIPSVQWKSDSFAGLGFSYGFAPITNWEVGLSVRPLSRWYIAGDLGFMDIMDFLPPGDKTFTDVTTVRSGSGVGTDVGLTWNPNKDTRLGFSWQNLGDVSFSGSEAPPSLQQMISIGGLQRFHLGRWDWDFLADLQDITNRHGFNLLRLLHFGTEFGRSVFGRDHDFGITAGINEGYLCGGIFADLYIARLDVSSYAVELGHSPGQKIDRRLAASIRSTMTF